MGDPGTIAELSMGRKVDAAAKLATMGTETPVRGAV
jgi:hypothetical protein